MSAAALYRPGGIQFRGGARHGVCVHAGSVVGFYAETPDGGWKVVIPGECQRHVEDRGMAEAMLQREAERRAGL